MIERAGHRHLAAALAALVVTLALAGCAPDREAPAEAGPTPIVVELRLLPLAGPAAAPMAEISAMCWCGDRLVLVPQHPERFGERPGELGLFVLDRADIEAFLDGRRSEPLEPRHVILAAPDLLAILPGWDGLEAAAASGDTIFLAVEASVQGRMTGYLLRGLLDGTVMPPRLDLDTERIASIPVPTTIANMSQEALVLAPGRVGVLFEANGVNVNPGAHIAVFGRDLDYRGTVPLEHVEYRITDACDVRPDSTFWVINYYFPGEGAALDPPRRPRRPVEQLLELRFDGERVVRSGRAPLDLRADPDQPPRNWEALARLGDRGFLIMTDRYPTTMLAFVPLPADAPPSDGDPP